MGQENYAAIAKDLDIVYDTLGGDYTLEAFKVIKKGGTVVSIAGDLDEFTAKDLGLNKLIRLLLALKRRKITKQAKAKSAHYHFVLMDPNASQLADIKTLIEKQLIKPVIDQVFPLSDAVEALLYQESGRAKGKIVIGMKS